MTRCSQGKGCGKTRIKAKRLADGTVVGVRRFRLPPGTLRDWEQGVREPDSAAKSYLRVIAKNPQAVLGALES